MLETPIPNLVRLDIDSRVVHQLGEELITDTGQALLELIKNSYDADSPDCLIHVNTKSRWFLVEGVMYAEDDENYLKLPDDKKATGREFLGHLTVKDRGSGMSLETILKGWLVISISAKRDFKAQGKVTPIYNRTPLGDKGLGRLGTMKLGGFLRIETQILNAANGVSASFSWDDCVSGRLLSQVPIQLRDLPAQKESGTKITVVGLRDVQYWRSTSELKRLERQLSTLISPFATFENFKIDIQSDGHVVAYQDAKDYLEMALAMFELTWDNANGVLETKGAVKIDQFQVRRKDEFFENHVVADNGEELFDFFLEHKDTKDMRLERGAGKWFVSFTTEKTKTELGELLANEDREDPGPLAAAIYSFNVDPYRRAPMGADLPKVPDFVKEHSGVFVFRDNFRIRMGEDWLQLGANATTGSSYYGLRPKNTLGWIALSARENQKLIEKSDREGFLDNKAKRGFDFLSFEFRNMINGNLEALRRTYLDFKKEIEKREAGKPKEYNLENAAADLRLARKSAGSLATKLGEVAGSLEKSKTLATSLGDFVAGKGENKQAAEKTVKTLMDLLEKLEPLSAQVVNMAKDLASVDIAVKTMEDEVETLGQRMEDLHHFAAIGVSANALIHELPNRIAETVFAVDSAITMLRKMEVKNSRLFETMERIKVNTAQIGNRIKFMDPMLRSEKNRKDEFEVASFLDGMKVFFQSELEPHGIKIEIENKSPFSAKINRGRLTQVFDNLIRNSDYWLKYFGKQEGSAGLAIHIVVERPTITFSDTGYGIDPKIEDRLFEIFVSGKTGAIGHGMGLFISKELMNADGCSLRLLPQRNRHGRRYIFEINLEAVAV